MQSDLTLVVDGNNMAHRARHAYQLSHRGKDTSVLFGVVKMLSSLIKRYRPYACVICWDGGTPNFRRELIPDYKANRNRSDDDAYEQFVSQLQELLEVLPYFGILNIQRTGIEADDLMYHVSRMLDGSVMIISGDDDLLQAVSTNCDVLKPGKPDKLYTIDNFEDEVGVPVERFVVYKVLQGDGSDNIPGVKGVGPKNAAKIVMGDCPERLRDKVQEFYDGGAFADAYDAIVLEFDIVGARYVILNASYVRYNYKRAMRWCIDNAFASIVESGMLNTVFSALRRPAFREDAVRTPRVWDYRKDLLDDEDETRNGKDH